MSPAEYVPILCRLAGHERTVVKLIADFAGVATGRALRNAREIAAIWSGGDGGGDGGRAVNGQC